MAVAQQRFVLDQSWPYSIANTLILGRTPSNQRGFTVNYVNQTPVVRFMVISASFVIVVAGLQAATSLLIPFFWRFSLRSSSGPFDGLQQCGHSTGGALGLVNLGMVIVSLIFIGLLGVSLSSFSNQLPVYQERLSEQVETLDQMLVQIGVAPEQHIGSIIAGIPAVIFAFIEFGPGLVVLLVIAVFVLVNIIVGYMLEPKMLGEGLRLSTWLSSSRWFFGAGFWGRSA